MDTTILNDPGFQTLPKGVKRMLVASEAYFFDQPAPHPEVLEENGYASRPVWEPLGRGGYGQGVMQSLLPGLAAHEGV
jgi:hypothetical protein